MVGPGPSSELWLPPLHCQLLNVDNSFRYRELLKIKKKKQSMDHFPNQSPYLKIAITYTLRTFVLPKVKSFEKRLAILGLFSLFLSFHYS